MNFAALGSTVKALMEPMFEGFDKCVDFWIKYGRGVALLPTPLVSTVTSLHYFCYFRCQSVVYFSCERYCGVGALLHCDL